MINIYTEKEIEIMQQGGRILAKIMKKIIKEVRPGIATDYLNKVAEDLIFSYGRAKLDSNHAQRGGAESSFKGFNNYPKALCVSINEEIVHGLPSERKLKQGDILSLDLGIRFKGYCTDLAVTIPVGKVDKRVAEIIEVTKKALDIGIKQCKAGNSLNDIGAAIQKYVESQGLNVVRELCGHGIGKKIHEDPQILNYAHPSTALRTELRPGMVLALEPMVVMGDWRIEKGKDGFSYKTKDNSPSSHFEHTIAITKKGTVILTRA